MDPLTIGLLAGGVGAPLVGGLANWLFGGGTPKQPKMPGQAVPDTKPPLVVPQAPQSQFMPPQMGSGGRGGGDSSNEEVLSRALRQWMGR